MFKLKTKLTNAGWNITIKYYMKYSTDLFDVEKGNLRDEKS